MNRMLPIVFFTLIVFIPDTARSQLEQGHGLGLGHGIAEELNLSVEQIEQLTCDVPGEGRTIKEEFLVEKEKLNELMRQKDISDDEILEQLEIVNGLQAAFNKHRLNKMLQARRVLNAEQFEKLLQLRKSHNPLAEQGHRHGSGHGHGRGHGYGRNK